MQLSLRATTLRMLALAGLAAAVALISNALASPARRLAWSGSALAPLLPTPATVRPATSEPVPLPPPAAAVRHEVPVPLRPTASAASAAPRSITSPAAPPPEAPVSSPIREISGAEAWKAFQAGVPFLDARRSAEFAEGRVAGAWCTPIWESDIDDRLIAFKAARRPGPEDPILIYCGGGDCRDSHLLAAKLLKEGYFHLLIYRDGYPDWVAQGHPVEKGPP